MTDLDQNQLLAALDPSDLALLRPRLTRIHLRQHEVLQAAGEVIEHIYFPIEGMISVVASFPSGEEIEIAAIGREGAIGTKVGLYPQFAFATALVQLPGAAWRIPLLTFQEIAKGNVALTHIAMCAHDIMSANLQQAAACNAIHHVEGRLARWLLHAADRSATEELPLTRSSWGRCLASGARP